MADWKQYEKQIFDKIEKEFAGCEVKKDQKKKGRFSKVDRQVDVLAEGRIFNQDTFCVVECKHFAKNVDVKIIDGFVGFLDDVGAKFGILVTSKGFSEGAINRAKGADSISKIEIVPFELWEDYSFFDLYGIDGYSRKFAELTGRLYQLEDWTIRIAGVDTQVAYDEITQSGEFYCPNPDCGFPIEFDAAYETVVECRCGTKYKGSEPLDSDGIGELVIEVVE